MSPADASTHDLAELRARVEALEQAVQAGLGPGTATGQPTAPSGADADPSAASAANGTAAPATAAPAPAAAPSAATPTAAATAAATPATTAPAAPSPATDVFWALNTIKSMVPAPGAVLYAGSVTLPGGGAADWQYALTTDDILARDWSRPSSTSALAALGHPVRLRLLQSIATGTVAVADLAALEGVGTTGQVYHHVNQLIAAGWVYSTSRGHYGIPPERVVPLLTVILAAGGI